MRMYGAQVGQRLIVFLDPSPCNDVTARTDSDTHQIPKLPELHDKQVPSDKAGTCLLLDMRENESVARIQASQVELDAFNNQALLATPAMNRNLALHAR